MRSCLLRSWLWIAAALLLLMAAGASPATASGVLQVTKTADTADGACDSDCSLREAIIAANADPDASTINVPAGVYTLTIPGDHEEQAAQDDLDLNTDITIVGDSAATTIIDGGGIARIFDIVPFDTTVNISGLTLRNGVASTIGGAMDTHAHTTLTDIVVMGNEATEGGGISNRGDLTLMRVTISGNEATSGNGGGLRNEETGQVSVENTTISGNTATGSGGGMEIAGSGDLVNVTVTLNTSADGAGINAPGDLDVVNSLVAGNNGDDCGEAPTSLGHNLEGDGTCGFGATGDLTVADPMLGPLADNGGPSMTHALLEGSEAIDAGDDTECPATDQRGEPRPSGDACDIGAFEVQVVVTVPLTWGDDNCSGAADPVDALITLRFDAGLPANTGECPDMGQVVEVLDASPHPWGDIDCSGAVDPVDALKKLRFDAGLSVPHPAGCPAAGAEVMVVVD